MSDPKPVPMDKTIPATDAGRRHNTNISPQGEIHPDDVRPGSKFTPEGDGENVPGVMPAATDPVE